MVWLTGAAPALSITRSGDNAAIAAVLCFCLVADANTSWRAVGAAWMIARPEEAAKVAVTRAINGRDEALNLVDLYDGELPERYLPDVLEYMDLSRERFLQIADSFRPAHLWDKRGDGWWLTQRAAGVPKNFGFLK